MIQLNNIALLMELFLVVFSCELVLFVNDNSIIAERN